MKKICALIIISFLFITSLTVYGGTTLTEPLGGTTSEGLVWCYNNESRSEIWIIGFDSRIIPESVTIPVEITRWSIILQKDVTAPVTRICSEAFKHCNQIKDIKIPKGITAIDAWAFGFCPNLTSVELPEGLKVISDWTFYKCEKLASITLPSTITNIGKGAFSDCKELSEMIIPPNVTAIETQAFSHCTSLSRFLIPESVTKMGESSPALNVPYAVIDSSVLPTDSEVPAIEIYGVPGSYIEEYANEFEHFAFKPVSEYPNNTADNDVISVTVNDKNIVFDQPPTAGAALWTGTARIPCSPVTSFCSTAQNWVVRKNASSIWVTKRSPI